ncbi:MAG TPA: amidase [Nocardioidaceae bacterium]|nr:amidase [Nocardioidaceae bacterium]
MRLHTFTDDALGDHDAVALADLVARGERSPRELAEASLARRAQAEGLDAVEVVLPEPRVSEAGRLRGVPTFLKDNVDVRGLPTGHGSEAFTGRRKSRNDPYVDQYLGTGLTLLGKSRLPEFGFNASTEFMTRPPVRNPWHTEHSVGASSGGAAALVAAGVVPIAHANDGGGSIRIPAACAGLVGLKPTRGRHVDAKLAKTLPINMVSEGVVTRSVRDTAHFVAAMEDVWRNPSLEPVGLVEGVADRTYRIGVLTETVNGAPVHPETQAAVDQVVRVLEKLGHEVEEVPLPVGPQFVEDFTLYWGLLATLSTTVGAPTFGFPFHQRRLDGLTKGLRGHHLKNVHRTPGALRRLKAVAATYDVTMAGFDAVVCPTLAHPAPRLGHLSPTQPFDELMLKLQQYVVTTPVHNIAGTPGLSMPVGLSTDGLPIGVHLSGTRGGERTLLELAYLIEAELPAPRIQE